MTTLISAPSRTGQLPAVLAVAVTVTLWASAFVGVRAVGADFSPGALALGRQLTGSVGLTAIVVVTAWRRGRPPVLPRGRVLAGALAWGVAWFGLYNLALNSTERRLDAGTTALMVNLAPVLIGVLAGVFLGEGFPRRLLAGLGVALAGVAVITAATSTSSRNVTGLLLGLGAALLYAVGAIVQKRLLAHVEALTLTWIGCLAGTLACLPFAAQLVTAVPVAPLSSILGVVYLGAFPTAIGFLTWGFALSRMAAGRLAATTYAVPALVVVLSALLLGELVAPLALAGGALCLTGVAIATLRR